MSENIPEFDNIHPDIDQQGLDETIAKLSQESNCPYSKVIGYINKFGNHMTPDRLPKLKKIMSYFLYNVLAKKDTAIKIDVTVPETLKMRNQEKLKKHIADVMFLQQEVYGLLNEGLNYDANSAFEGLRNEAANIDLQDPLEREVYGVNFIIVFQQQLIKILKKREFSKWETEEYQKLLEISREYENLTNSGAVSFGRGFLHGAADGATMFWSMVCNIPEVFEKKYGKMPTKEQYRSVVEKNIKAFIVPTSSVTMPALVNVIRPHADTDEQSYIDNNPTDMNVNNFTLADDGDLLPTGHYIKERVKGLRSLEFEFKIAYDTIPGFHASDYHLRTGCPALTAQTADGTSIVEQYCRDILALLDKIYFPYWEK